MVWVESDTSKLHQSKWQRPAIRLVLKIEADSGMEMGEIFCQNLEFPLIHQRVLQTKTCGIDGIRRLPLSFESANETFFESRRVELDGAFTDNSWASEGGCRQIC